MPNRLKNIVGQTYNWLTVIERAPENNTQGKPQWICKCKCGTIKVVTGSHLKSGNVKSCGCWHKEITKEKHHAWSGVGDISGGWWHRHISNKIQGNRRKGILIEITKQDAWDQYIKQQGKCALTGIPIKISMISTENTASIDRINNNGHYAKDNIQWVHKHINFMKWIHEQDYFIDLCRKVATYN